MSQLSSIAEDGGRLALHPLEVKGRFIRWRRRVFVLLMLVYLVLPLWKVGGFPALHLDLEQRHFFILGKTFNAQDFGLVLLGVGTFVFGLLAVTAWRGRVWCGWACPQTVFLEGLYR